MTAACFARDTVKNRDAANGTMNKHVRIGPTKSKDIALISILKQGTPYPLVESDCSDRETLPLESKRAVESRLLVREYALEYWDLFVTKQHCWLSEMRCQTNGTVL